MIGKMIFRGLILLGASAAGYFAGKKAGRREAAGFCGGRDDSSFPVKEAEAETGEQGTTPVQEAGENGGKTDPQ
jgi:hypothetical protein